MGKRYWVLLALVALACGGRARFDGDSTSSAGQSGGSVGNAGTGAQSAAGASAGGADAGDAVSCPNGPLDAQPTEGAACESVGMSCQGSGSLSRPLTAVCGAGLTWQIECPADMAFGPCTCPHPIGDRVPTNHRAAPLPVCSNIRAASPTSPDQTCAGADAGICGNSECSQDSQCLSGRNGRCLQRGPLPGYSCSYDACVTDSQCPNGSVCQCRDPLNGVDPNYCTDPSNCRVDADCGEHGYCSLSGTNEWCGAFYACHTPSDECLNDSDCPGSTPCDYDSNAKHWRCTYGCGPAPP